ncbi:MAG: hypothetical protein A2V86_12435 [Deltaproteobacteria bacterium RBG_16_49_23]|nr:MAG: hypothetical protein A2V86_12435 [Deltaproteobacteria bacterium RBG_16_49_23]
MDISFHDTNGSIPLLKRYFPENLPWPLFACLRTGKRLPKRGSSSLSQSLPARSAPAKAGEERRD